MVIEKKDPRDFITCNDVRNIKYVGRRKIHRGKCLTEISAATSGSYLVMHVANLLH